MKPHWILCFAVPDEMRPLLASWRRAGRQVSRVRNPGSGHRPGQACWVTEGVTLRVTGMGARSAEAVPLGPVRMEGGRMASVSVSDLDRPVRLLTCGFAGGLQSHARHGDVLCEVDDDWDLGADLVRAGARPGRFHTSDRVCVLGEEKRALGRHTGADAVEMESGILRQRARRHGIPSATVRVISDAVDEDLPLDFNRVMREEGTMDWGRFSLLLLQSPGRVIRLIRFQGQVHRAAQRLGQVVGTLVG